MSSKDGGGDYLRKGILLQTDFQPQWSKEVDRHRRPWETGESIPGSQSGALVQVPTSRTEQLPEGIWKMVFLQCLGTLSWNKSIVTQARPRTEDCSRFMPP